MWRPFFLTVDAGRKNVIDCVGVKSETVASTYITAKARDLDAEYPALNESVPFSKCARAHTSSNGFSRTDENRTHRKLNAKEAARNGFKGWRRTPLRDLRSSPYLHHAVGEGIAIPVVQKLAGHTSIATTMRYVHLNDQDVLAAMRKVEDAKSRHTPSIPTSNRSEHEAEESAPIH